MEEKGNRKYKAISIRTFGIIMIVVAFIMAIILQYSVHDVKVASDRTQEMSDIYIDGQISLVNMKTSSDAMVERVRTFVATGDIRYLEEYIDNLSDAESRAKTLDEIVEKLNGTSSHDQIQLVMKEIDNMIEAEMHSLKLALTGYEIDETKYTDKLILPELSDEESKLSHEQMIDKANELLFNEEYQIYRNQFADNIEQCIRSLSEYTSLHRQDSYDTITYYQNNQRIAITISLILVILDVIVFWIFVVKPISNNVAHINKNEYLEVRGLKDVQIMADAYNRMYDRIEKDKEKLSYEASHDSLTGLLNRNAYNLSQSDLDDTNFCFILLDVDDFKGFNDTFGHDVGDKVLQKIARVLSSNARSEDYVFRLGGDEFAIVLQGVKEENRNIIEKKMEKVRNDLLIKDDDTPVIKISLGATFSSGKLDMDRIYKEADVALYRAKEEKNRMVFYEDVN